LTQIGQICPDYVPQEFHSGRFQTCESVVLKNGDICKVGSWVVLCPPGTRQHLGHVAEIIQQVGSQNELFSQVDYILVQQAEVSDIVEPYQMPCVILQDTHILVADLQV
jgi:hypothetical protein